MVKGEPKGEGVEGEQVEGEMAVAIVRDTSGRGVAGATANGRDECLLEGERDD
jgi:hypothetical protein